MRLWKERLGPTRPEVPETVIIDRRRKKESSGKVCAACLADSVGLCSVHERDTTNVNSDEQRSFWDTVVAEAAKGGIPENFTKPEIATPGEAEQIDDALADMPDRIPGDTDEEGDAVRESNAREREPAGPELMEISDEQVGRALAPLSDKRRLEAVDRKRRSDKDEARSTSHLLAHSPNIHCIACRQAKVTNVRFNRKEREFMSEARAFGDRVTADTIVLKGTRDRGVHGETNAIVFLDLATGWIDCIPVKSRHTDETVRAITQFQGPESYIKQLYTDQAPEFDKACGKVGTCNATSTPGMPRTNGIAECKVKEVIRGARVLLRQAGLDLKWWPYAVRAYCFHQNCDDRDGPSVYEKRYGEEMDEVDLRPFGCLVDYLPIAPKPRRAQPESKG